MLVHAEDPEVIARASEAGGRDDAAKGRANYRAYLATRPAAAEAELGEIERLLAILRE